MHVHCKVQKKSVTLVKGTRSVIILLTSHQWRRAWQPTPVFLPGESHGQRSLGGYCPWGRRESEATYRLNDKLLPSGPWLCAHQHKFQQEGGRAGCLSQAGVSLLVPPSHPTPPPCHHQGQKKTSSLIATLPG